MKIKIRSEKIVSNYPIWRIYDEFGNQLDFYDRQTEDYKGLTKAELVEILIKKGQSEDKIEPL